MSSFASVWDVTSGLPSDPLRDLTEFTSLCEGLDHPEGVAIGPDGTLYAGGEAGQIYRISPEGVVKQIASIDGFALGLTVDGENNIYVCETTGKTVKRAAPDGTVSVYSTGTSDQPMVAPNYSVFDAAGNLYVTDSGHWNGKDGRILVVRPNGTTELFTDQIKAFPNGAALSPDTQWLYVVSSELPGIERVRIQDNGTAGEVETVLDLPRNVPDGIAFNKDGALFIACYSPSVIYQLRKDGTLDVLGYDWQNTQLAAPTNIVFYGPQRTTMIIGSLSRWHLTSIEMEVPGLPLHYPKLPK